MANAQEVIDKYDIAVGDLQILIAEYQSKIQQIDSKVDSAVSNVNAAIPTAINTQLLQALYLDTITGNDENNGAATTPFKSLKALIDSVPVGSTVVIYGPDNQTVTIDDKITLLNKKVVFRLNNATLNANAPIDVYSSSLKFSYTLVAINQTIDYFIHHFSADIRLETTLITPPATVGALFKQNYYGGEVSYPGSHHSNVLVACKVGNAAIEYSVFDASFYKASMEVTAHNIILGINVNLFNPIYEFNQVGTKGVYFVGA